MFTIKAICGLTELSYLTGFYLSKKEATIALVEFSDYNSNYAIIEIENIIEFPFFIIESENKFMYFQHQMEIVNHVKTNHYNENQNGILFNLYFINESYNNSEGSDKMGDWRHYHINNYDLLNIEDEIFFEEILN